MTAPEAVPVFKWFGRPGKVAVMYVICFSRDLVMYVYPNGTWKRSPISQAEFESFAVHRTRESKEGWQEI